MPLPILYSFRRCPYAIRARMALVYARINFEIREIELKNKPEEMLVISPKGTVPVLQLADGTVLEESLDIMHWALDQADPDAWYPSDEKVRQAIDQLIEQNDGPFKEAIDAYKYPESSESAHAARVKGASFLAQLEKILEENKFLCGESTSLADVALFPFIRQFANVDKVWFDAEPLPHLKIMTQYFLKSALFISAMKKYPPWKKGDAPLEFQSDRV
jgi:glutathione S-transferase